MRLIGNRSRFPGLKKNAKNYTKTRQFLIPSTEIKDLWREKGKNCNLPTPLSMSNLEPKKKCIELPEFVKQPTST
jgi:hypothetical protein